MTSDPILKGTSSEILVHELLEIMVSDAENSERLLRCLTEDCVWVMEPGGTEYHGIREIKAFVEIAMSSRSHDTGQHRIQVTNWFANDTNASVEYTHGARLTGRFIAGLRGSIKTGISRYCITYHIREGKFDRIHEYINATSWPINAVIPLVLRYLHRLAMKRLRECN